MGQDVQIENELTLMAQGVQIEDKLTLKALCADRKPNERLKYALRMHCKRLQTAQLSIQPGFLYTAYRAVMLTDSTQRIRADFLTYCCLVQRLESQVTEAVDCVM
jgi:hypothetical protein